METAKKLNVWSLKNSKFSLILNRKLAILFFLAFLCLGSLLFSISKGALDITVGEVYRAIFIERNTVNHQIIWNVRLPRTLVAGLVGICLSLSGAILQGVMRNPLAAPNIIGVSSGAGLMAYIIMILFPSYYYLVPIGAFVGALLATLLIYLLAWKDGIQPTRMILAGVAVSSFLSAWINSLMIFFPDRVVGVIGFMVGGLSTRTWPHFNVLWPYASLGIAITFLFSKKLNILTLGDEAANNLGIHVERTRLILIALASLLAGSAVSVVGLLGFVGLIVPHTARLLIGSDYRYLFPATAILGATTVIFCDTIARVILSPIEIPVGIIMSLLGAPFFLYLLRERRRGIL
ncbi:FecCD family ABC transporter permease [Alkaliphilus peptidifermentans]|uniref:Iron complex transport system permease protein n=1 Tax=Alkaliphilus peptidifermentans DSM 18978 TaxID=1120976 RepID=A0A1G5ARY8_9FIRM|nr:iron ABC transporter permease [Alkaliphilus peptidifermentans]SCX80629.1 iron complex transport system permease protein [Alkaliphilus peptidifermentans DSM 18978]